jgi:ubiquinone/menaquinone biosynthesis C-methylase UbiE
MGPNPLWLTEWLCELMDLRPGMRVLDLGCGRAPSSIFLAFELWRCQERGEDAKVVAADQGRYMGFMRLVGRTGKR